MSKHEIKNCERCDAAFECKLGDIANCQCSTVVLSDSMRDFLENSFFDCLCQNCLTELNAKVNAVQTTLADDFYLENERVVFTEMYHIRRGYCCQSGCRHCPFGFRKG